MSFPNIPRINPPFTQPRLPNLNPRLPVIPNLNLPRIRTLNPNIGRAGINLGNDIRPSMIDYRQPDVFYQQPEVYFQPQQAQPQPQQVVVQAELPSWLLPLGLIAIGGLVLYALVKK